jgi:hypothetical protein
VALQLPEGTRLAVSISADFDAHCVWMGTFGLSSPGYLARGEFGAEVGVPRLLALFARHDLRTTWCIPSHSLQTFPRQSRAIVAAGHEVAAHGCYHEPIPKLEPDEERRLMLLQLAEHERLLGRRPQGYRSPAWDFSDATLGLLEELGFVWDSSLMGRDFEVYRPRPVATVDREQGNSFGPPSPIIEIPVSWYLDEGRRYSSGRWPKNLVWFDKSNSTHALEGLPTGAVLPTAAAPCAQGQCPSTGATEPTAGTPSPSGFVAKALPNARATS